MRKIVMLFLAGMMLAGTLFAKKAQQGDVIRVLAIGNSFSVDAVEQNLWNLAQSEGITLIIGNLYKGGCSLERHARNLKGNITDYEYRKIGFDGKRVNTKKFTMERALADEDWDIVTIQQSSGNSGLYETYHPFIDELLTYVKARVSKKCKLMFHQTWAYQGNSTHRDFPRYDKNQVKMYNAIIRSVKQAMKDTKLKKVIPSGTAVQNARHTFIGDTMTRDGYHMNKLYGRYTIACAWLEALTGHSAVGNKYAPEGMSEQQIKATQQAAHNAVKKPWKVTD